MEVQDYINKLVEAMKEKMSVFDLGAVLIKPVQRILKYPLLLNELLKVCTHGTSSPYVVLIDRFLSITY